MGLQYDFPLLKLDNVHEWKKAAWGVLCENNCSKAVPSPQTWLQNVIHLAAGAAGVSPSAAVKDESPGDRATPEMDERALGLLMRMVTEPYKNIVLNANNAAEAWANLIAAVQPYSAAMVVKMEERWARTTMANNAKVEDHVNGLVALREKLAAAGVVYSDEALVRKVMMTLSRRFTDYKMTRRGGMPSLPTLLCELLVYEGLMTHI
ncbi:hypothetical protein MNEG_6738 [Monoraphidium neglectum]|jgi:hypothetical protein|uniref:Uncharacterized protein n=1 Tax=Monoraphidium neglectum TaxID=145388 RepID=A0A0D2JQ75_9CHLO|nr:hypothetical protein MNEG_6738 [Monoraphidium neglectum]KIZ01223.1 hypothetical protein MNEG_6738 [Monoraphidium neglectum]|eukprot:XP_013900242.1 hypothetical protein MNEG_6738 [Monoraphidium neglectum]